MPDRNDIFICRFAEVALRRRGEPAIALRNGTVISYADLLGHACGIAARLREMGIKKGDMVGLDIPRGSEWVSGFLGLWVAGAVPLAIDPKWPPARRTTVFDIVEPVATITVDDIARTSRDDASALPVCDAGRGSPAYIIATSGTSGKPKAVEVSHAGITPMLDAQIAMFQVCERSRCLWVHNAAFDASISDIGTALLAGATLCIDTEHEPTDVEALTGAIREMGITHIDLPPALLPHIDPKSLGRALETVIIGGEVAPAEQVRLWANRYRVINVYGPTEATVCTSMINAGTGWTEPLIGTPIPGVRHLICDGEDQEVSTGTGGELHIAGDAVALRYIRDPGQTADRFYLREGGRCFRTRDVVKETSPGNYQFLGRLDRQCKVNGLLICPEEIEAALTRNKLVKRACVIPLPKPDGSTTLAAAVETTLPAEELRAHLADLLPSWMLPSLLVPVQTLPSLPNGKVDLKGVESWIIKESAPEPDRVSDAYEARLLELAKVALGGIPISRDDDFFHAGGDSLAVLRLLAAASKEGIDLTADSLATGRSISGVATLMRSKDRGGYAMPIRDLELEAERQVNMFGAPESSLKCLPESEALSKILLTGATGFLGSCLLGEILRMCDAEIICLVRGGLPDALGRIRSNLAAHGFPVVSEGRIRVVGGDLQKDSFGLPRDEWNSLAGSVDAVIHCAGDTRLLMDFRTLSPANVDGTRRVLEFCLSGRPKRLHHASTLSVFVDRSPCRRICKEEDDLGGEGCVFGGYAQSKWVAERMVGSIRDRLPSTATYRLGLLTANSNTGHLSQVDWLNRYLAAVSEEDLTELDENLSFDFTPVDGAAEAMSRIITGKAGAGHGVYHITSGQKVSAKMLREAIRRRDSRPIGQSSSDIVKTGSSPDPALARSLDLFKATGTTFLTTQAERAIGSPPVRYPTVDTARIVEIMDRISNG